MSLPKGMLGELAKKTVASAAAFDNALDAEEAATPATPATPAMVDTLSIVATSVVPGQNLPPLVVPLNGITSNYSETTSVPAPVQEDRLLFRRSARTKIQKVEKKRVHYSIEADLVDWAEDAYHDYRRADGSRVRSASEYVSELLRAARAHHK
jgi:hypothetical protein